MGADFEGVVEVVEEEGPDGEHDVPADDEEGEPEGEMGKGLEADEAEGE